MKRMFTAAAAAAGSLALLGGALVAGGGPALADKPPGQAWGAAASGPQILAPVARVTTGDPARVAAHANLAGLLATSAIVDRADESGAWSRIGGGIVLSLPNQGALTSAGVRSWCRAGSNGNAYGGAHIFSGAIMELGYQTIGLPPDPAPNTVLTLPGGAGTITLNYQNTVGDITTFEAIRAVLGSQTVDLAVSQCFSPLPA